MLDLFLNHRVVAFHAYAVILILAMLRWGGGAERVTAAVWGLIFLVVHRGYHVMVDDGPWARIELTDIDYFHAGMDFVGALALVTIALHANRNYLLWVAAFQVLKLGGHFARGLTETVSPISYFIMIFGPGYFQLLAMTFGLWFHRKRLARYGEYRDWRLVIAPRLVPYIGRGPQ